MKTMTTMEMTTTTNWIQTFFGISTTIGTPQEAKWAPVCGILKCFMGF